MECNLWRFPSERDMFKRERCNAPSYCMEILVDKTWQFNRKYTHRRIMVLLSIGLLSLSIGIRIPHCCIHVFLISYDRNSTHSIHVHGCSIGSFFVEPDSFQKISPNQSSQKVSPKKNPALFFHIPLEDDGFLPKIMCFWWKRKHQPWVARCPLVWGRCFGISSFCQATFFREWNKTGGGGGRFFFGGVGLCWWKNDLEKSPAHLKTIGNNHNKKRESIWCIFLFFWFCFWKPGGFFGHVNILDALHCGVVAY